MKDTPHRVWDHNLQAMRDLAEDEWELESHWAGALEVHGNKMPGHDWVIVVPKYKLDAAEAALTAALETQHKKATTQSNTYATTT